MITIRTVPRSGLPRRPRAARLVASIDVEWTKNYRIPNGNVPFCYSITWLAVPTRGVVDLVDLPVQVLSRYVESTAETAELVRVAATDIAAALQHADLLVGHQLSSDLAVLHAASAVHAAPAVASQALVGVRAAWHARHDTPARPVLAQRPARGEHQARVLDTRYDTDHVLTVPSRRLVDVCADLGLDVTQPELRGTSMTALHRRWLDQADSQAREKITVLNVRHGLSASLVALVAADAAVPQAISINRMLADALPQEPLSWLQHPTFASLLTVGPRPPAPDDVDVVALSEEQLAASSR